MKLAGCLVSHKVCVGVCVFWQAQTTNFVNGVSLAALHRYIDAHVRAY